MKWFILIICAIWILSGCYTTHVYKSKCVPHKSEIGFAIGSILVAIINGIAWYWLFKMINLL
jgi:hypothetical protein